MAWIKGQHLPPKHIWPQFSVGGAVIGANKDNTNTLQNILFNRDGTNGQGAHGSPPPAGATVNTIGRKGTNNGGLDESSRANGVVNVSVNSILPLTSTVKPTGMFNGMVTEQRRDGNDVPAAPNNRKPPASGTGKDDRRSVCVLRVCRRGRVRVEPLSRVQHMRGRRAPLLLPVSKRHTQAWRACYHRTSRLCLY
jgi:hypothetical protein